MESFAEAKKLDGYNIIKRFWDVAPDQDGYKGDHALLFFALFEFINTNRWKATEIEYDRVISRVRMGKKNYLDCRRWLVQHGFLVVVEGRGDYSKARFSILDAVLFGTASSTANGTGKPGKKSGNAVSDAVLFSTASDTASGTANGTHLKEDSKDNKDVKTQHQQQPDLAALDAGGDGVAAARQIECLLADSAKLQPATPASGQNPPPVAPAPLPVSRQIRDMLLASGPHRRYAMEQMKVALDNEQYADLLEKFILQRECEATETIPAFQSVALTKRHFMNWLGKQTELKTQTNGNATGPQRTATNLRPTAVGRVDYRGTGSTVDVDL